MRWLVLKVDCLVILVVLEIAHAGSGWYAGALLYCMFSPWHLLVSAKRESDETEGEEITG